MKTPFWKLELRGSRKKKVEEAAVEPAETGAKKPLKARGFTMPRLELPTRSRKSTARHKELVGLKIGASQIAAARVSNNGVAEVTQVAREDIDPGIVVGGELRDPEALAVALKHFFQVNKLPRKGIRLGIANNRIGVRTFEITGIEDPKQLTNAIRFRAQEALPIPIEEAVLDYHILSETTNEEGETVRKILLVVAYRELVDRYVSACRDAGLSLAGIDLEAFALLRSLAAPREDDGPAAAALVAVAVGHDRSTFAVSDGRVCEFTRVLDWGGSTLSVAIARALDMTPSEADPIKHAISLEPGPAPEGVSEEVATAAREAVKGQINNFARELVSSLQFYQNQPGSLGIGEIILTGGTAHLPGFAAELQRLIGVRVKLGDPLVRVKVGKRVQEPEQLGSLAIAIGLGIEDCMRAVNLLPRDDPNRRTKTNVPVVVGVAGAVLSTALIGMMFMSASGSVHDRQQQLDALRAELAVVPPPIQQSSAQAGLQEEQKARVTAVLDGDGTPRRLGPRAA